MKIFESIIQDKGLSGNFSDIRQQIIISKLIRSINNKIKKDHRNQLIVTPESDILFYDNTNSLHPRNADIVIWKYSPDELKGIYNPLFIIELTNIKFPQDIKSSNNNDIIKLREYLQYISSLKEYILYNYEYKTIIKFSKNRNDEFIFSPDDYTSKFLKLKFNRSLKWER